MLFIIIFCTVKVATATLTDGLVAYYPFNNTKVDATGHGFTATNNGSLTAYTGNGKIGVGLQMNETNTFGINISSVASHFDGLEHMTICLWYYGNSTSITTTNPVSSFNRGLFNSAHQDLTQYGTDIYNEYALQQYRLNGYAGTLYAKGVWTYQCIVYDGTLSASARSKLYVNGTQVSFGTTATAPTSLPSATIFLIGGSGEGTYKAPRGIVDEVAIYNRSLNVTEIAELFNATDSGLTYPFTAPITVTPSYNITFTQRPSDINTSVVGNVLINATAINLTGNVTGFNSSAQTNMTLYYKINTSLNGGCAIFEQDRCIDNGTYHSVNMNKTAFDRFYYNIVERFIFPAYYPFNEGYIESTAIQNYSVYLNHNIRFLVFNMTTYTNPFLDIEFNAMNVSGSSLINIYYCNSSYTTGNPATSTSCEFVSNIPAIAFNISHCHGLSCHYVQPINIQNVSKTRNSSFIIVSSEPSVANAYNFRYTTNNSYDNRSFLIGNYASWSATTNIFDIHLHQFLNNDSLQYYANFTDGLNYTNISAQVTDYFDIVNQRPSTAYIYQPNASSRPTITATQNTSFNISWLPSTDFENDTLTYNVSIINLLNMNYPFGVVNQSMNSLMLTTNPTITPSGLYHAQVITCDNHSNCATGQTSWEFMLCENSYVKTTQPCIDNVKLIVWTDSNHCDEWLDFPAVTNNTYENCTSILYTQTVFTDDILLLGLLFLFLIIAMVMGIAVHPAFFGLCSLLTSLMIIVFINFDYPHISIYAGAFMTLLFAIIWYIVAKRNA